MEVLPQKNPGGNKNHENIQYYFYYYYLVCDAIGTAATPCLKYSGRIADVPAEIRTERLPKACLERYRFASFLFGSISDPFIVTSNNEISRVVALYIFVSQTGYEVHSASYPIITAGLKRQGREAEHSPPSNTKTRNGGAIPPLLHRFLWRGA
jgi:hypothetical protein